MFFIFRYGLLWLGIRTRRERSGRKQSGGLFSPTRITSEARRKHASACGKIPNPPPKNPSRKTWIFLSKLQAWYVITRLRVCNRRRRMSSPQVYFLQLDDIQHFVLLTFRLTTDYMHGFAVILSQCRSDCYCTCFLALAIDVAVNVGGGSHIRVTEPVLNHLHRHSVCEK